SREWDAMAPAGELPLLLADGNRPIVAARRGAPPSLDARARLGLFAVLFLACLPLLAASPPWAGAGLAGLFLGTSALARGGARVLAEPRTWLLAAGPLLLPLALSALARREEARPSRFRLPLAYVLL